MASQYGHTELRLNFEPYMTLISGGCNGLSTLAQNLKVTKQAAAQTVAELVRLGYIERKPCDVDGRAKLLSLTPEGQRMMADGVRAYLSVEKQFLRFVTRKQLDSARSALIGISQSLTVNPFSAKQLAGNRGGLGVVLSRVSDYASYRLMELTREQGHDQLKLSFAHILILLRPNGTRIQDIVRVRGLSKQAVGAIANELEALGYIARIPDPESPRQQRLHLTPQGFALISDSVHSVDLLDAEFTAQVGARKFNQLKRCINAIYDGLALAQLEFGELFDLELEQRAAQLQAELGPERARTLGRILSS